MTGLMDIGRSALTAYRAALTVTGENIANATTEGYRRRELLTSEVGLRAMTGTDATLRAQGVAIDDITRAQDDLIAGRARSAASLAGGAKAQHDLLGALESLIETGEGGLAAATSRFLDALGAVGGNPGSIALRQVALIEGQAMTGTLSGLASRALALRDESVARLGLVADEASRTLASLAEINRALGPLTSDADRNPLLDQRDRLLAGLAAQIGVQVVEDDRRRLRLTLGDRPGGLLLLEGDKAAGLSALAVPALLIRTADGGTTQSRSLPGGQAGGLMAGIGAIDAFLSDLDTQAQALAGAVNAAQAEGLDLSGRPGPALVSAQGWSVTPPMGSLRIEPAEGTPPQPPLSLLRTGAGTWQARDGAGTLLAEGREALLLPGLVLHPGPAPEGTRLSLAPSGGALHLRFLSVDPAALAAASATRTLAGAANRGTASAILASLPSAVPVAPLTGSAPHQAITLRSEGVAGLLPTGMARAVLTAPPLPRTLQILPALPAQSAEVNGLAHPVPPLTDAAALAGWLNAGPLSTLGAHARAEGGLLLIDTAPETALSLSLDGWPASLADAGAPAGDLAVFTRAGVQVAGPPLDAARAAQLLTPANGFDPGARWTMPASYRGLAAVTLPGGGHSLELAPGAATLTLASAGGREWALTPPAGASAAQVATALGALQTGMRFWARTEAILTAAADGPVSLVLARAGDEVRIEAPVQAGRLDLLAQAINRQTPLTGIEAQLSADGTRLALVQPGGADISLRLVQGAGLAVDGAALVAGADLRLTGRITAQSGDAFSVNGLTSATDAMAMGPVQAVPTAAGEGLRLTFAETPDLPGAVAWVDLAGTRIAVAAKGGAQAIASGLAGALVAAGFAGARAEGADLFLPSPDAQAGISPIGQALALDPLPDEALIVLATGPGVPRLGGQAQSAPGPSGSLTLTVTDAATRQVALSDTVTGDLLAQGTLDAQGRAVLAGFAVAISDPAALVTGDRFLHEANSDAPQDASHLPALLAPAEGLAARLREMVTALGAQTRASAGKAMAAAALHQAAERASAEAGAVDLDTEAARLLELQQGYQASAQTLQVARDLFDTLLRTL